LPASHPTVSSLLKANGYETALVGKWHLGNLPGFLPNEHGFDEFFGILEGAADYVSHVDPSRNPGLFENGEPVDRGGYLTDLLTERAVAFLSRPHPRPFFLSLQYTAPHWPWQGPGDAPYPDTASWVGGGSNETFAEMMRHLDRGVGEVLAALERSGLSGNTLVIFTSDNGGERYSDMGPLSERKMTLWEGGIRVPALVRWPGVIPAGTRTGQVAITMDWTATILSVARTEADPAYPLDGMDLLPVLTGESPVRPRTLWWRTFQRTKHRALRSGDWKYLGDEKGEYLFHLAEDASEERDLKAEHPERLAQLKALYRELESQMLEPVPLP
jgi:arylsulfatase A-like enzyme